MQGLGVRVAAMGFSWAVYLAQTGVMAMAEEAGEEIRTELGMEENPISMKNAMVEGGPPPGVAEDKPLHFEYIDDFGLLRSGGKEK